MKKIRTRKFRLKKWRIFVGILLLIVVFSSCFSGYDVNAGMNDSVIDKKRMDGIYAVANINGVDRIFYLNMYEMNGRVSYCIDLGVDITTSIYHSTNDFSVSYLTDEQIDYIRAISYFGYGYEGHLDYQYYMAAQELIWEYLGNVDVFWTNELSVDGDRIDIDFYKDDILQDKYMNDINLDLNLTEGQVYTVGDEVVLIDSNDILSNYEVVSTSFSTAIIEENKLVVKVGNKVEQEKIVLCRKGYYDYDGLLYYYDNSQKLISNGNYSCDEEIIKFDVKGVSLNVEVVDSATGINLPRGQASLEGAMYELWDVNDNLIGTYKTNAKGIFRADNLVFGTYYIKQVGASLGYLVNESLNKVEVGGDGLWIKLKQRVISNRFLLTKVYGEAGDYKPEVNVMFDVLDSNGKSYLYIFTDGAGKKEFDLPYGDYVIRQLTTISGYSKVDDIYVNVKDNSNDIVYYNLVDELIKVKVRIITLENLTLEEFELRDFSYRLRKDEENTYLEFNGEDVFSTNDKGELIIPIFLGYGDYVLEQVGVPEGVIINNKELEFSVNDNSKLSLVDGDLIMDVNFYNDIVMGQVEVFASKEIFYKNINEFGYEIVSRENSSFSLIAREDIVSNNKIIYKMGEEIDSKSTDKDGYLLFDNLYLGNYCLRDNETGDEKCFVLDSLDNITDVVSKKIEFIDYLDKGSIVINNVSNKGELIKGSVFELLDSDGMVIYTGATNENGIIKIENMLIGNDYCIRQRSSSFDYQKIDNNICFLLEGDKAIEVVNDLIVRETISVPDTLLEDIGFYEAVVVLVLIGTGIFVYKKIFASKLYR